MTAPKAACRPASVSPREMLGRTGALSGYPFRCLRAPQCAHPERTKHVQHIPATLGRQRGCGSRERPESLLGVV